MFCFKESNFFYMPSSGGIYHSINLRHGKKGSIGKWAKQSGIMDDIFAKDARMNMDRLDQIPWRLTDPIKIEIISMYKNYKRKDIDNDTKSILDGLSKAKIIGNDNKVYELNILKQPAVEEEGYIFNIIKL